MTIADLFRVSSPGLEVTIFDEPMQKKAMNDDSIQCASYILFNGLLKNCPMELMDEIIVGLEPIGFNDSNIYIELWEVD